jgi:hypothetical protein
VAPSVILLQDMVSPPPRQVSVQYSRKGGAGTGLLRVGLEGDGGAGKVSPVACFGSFGVGR